MFLLPTSSLFLSTSSLSLPHPSSSLFLIPLSTSSRFGKVQSVKFLPGGSSVPSQRKGGCNDTQQSSNVCATVAFIDIRSAAKALNNPDNKIEEKVLKTEYYEPPASSTSSSAIFIHETREDALLVQRQSSSGINSVTTSNSQLASSSSSQLASSSSSQLASSSSSNITSYAGPANTSQTPATSSSLPLPSSHGSIPLSALSAPSSLTPSTARTPSASLSSSTSSRLHHLTTSRR